MAVLVSHHSVAVIQHAQHQNPESETVNGNSAFINLIIYTHTIPTNTLKHLLYCWIAIS